MSRDYALFEPTRLPDGGVAGLPITAPPPGADPTTDTEGILADLAATDLPFSFPPQLVDGLIEVCFPEVYVDVSYPELVSFALDHRLGLQDADFDAILLQGDEDTAVHTTTVEGSAPYFSRAGLPHLLAYLTETYPEDAFTVIARDDHVYAQTKFLPDEGRWVVEYRDGSPDKHFQTHVITLDDAARALLAWADDESSFRSLEWHKLEL